MPILMLFIPFVSMVSIVAGVMLLSFAYDRVNVQKCVKCKYDMRGLPSLRCPECGHDNPRDDNPTPILCRRWMCFLGLSLIALPAVGVFALIGLYWNSL